MKIIVLIKTEILLNIKEYYNMILTYIIALLIIYNIIHGLYNRQNHKFKLGGAEEYRAQGFILGKTIFDKK